MATHFIAPSWWHNNNISLSHRILKKILSPIVVLYRSAARTRYRIVTPHVLSVPVICVGNVTMGGAGKTPFTIALVKLLQAQGRKPAIVSRGYGGEVRISTCVDVAHHSAQQVGDEPLLLAQFAPCYVGKDRRNSAEMAIAEGADVIVMDDGLQNPQLAKTLSFLVMDGGYGIGNGCLFPAGPLRESLADVFAKVQACVVIGKDSTGVIGELPRHLPLIRAQMVISLPESLQAGVSVVAFCGIARPAKFYESIAAAGLNCVATHDFPDHHPFTQAELEMLWQSAQNHHAPLVTTQKDWVRLLPEWQTKIIALPAQLVIHSEALLQQVLDSCLSIS